MSKTILGNIVQLLASILTIYGVADLSSQDQEAIIVTIGIVGQLAGFALVQYSRVSVGDVTPVLGIRK